MAHHRGLAWLIFIGGATFLIASDHSPVPAPQRLQIQTELHETVDIAKNKFDQFVANSQTQPKVEVTQQAQPKVNVTQQEAAANRTQSRQADTGQTTPIVSIVQDVSLRRTYYYTFAANDSQAVRNVFAHAVDVYNATGLVNLIPGKGTSTQNQIKFSTYHKQMPASQRDALELGQGGPEIISHVWGGTAINDATASLNVTYSESIAQSVAIHELGHALGLDHSTNAASVMYPVDQGKTALSAEDIAALKQIYEV
ncbi:matrixin family metalloprotease [Lacticaseibacillus saniviri]